MLQIIYRFCLTVVLVGGIAVYAFAQEAQDLQAAFGLIVKASAVEIVISQYNNEQETDQEVTYVVDLQTQLEGVKAANEFAAGEEVEILYVEANGAKVAKFVSKELLPEEDTQEDLIGSADQMPANVVVPSNNDL